MNFIIDIIVNRDGVTREEAREMYLACKEELMEAIEGNSIYTPEEVLLEYVGLEMDYIWNFI